MSDLKDFLEFRGLDLGSGQRGIAQNIATNAALTEGMAKATRDMGVRAADLAGQGLNTQYNY